MEKSKEIQMKQHVLGMLHDFMMQGEGGKFKPKAIEVEMIGEPKEGAEGKEDLDDFLKGASKDYEESGADKAADAVNAKKAGMSEEDWEGSEGDEEADEEASKKTSLKEFFKRK